MSLAILNRPVATAVSAPCTNTMRVMRGQRLELVRRGHEGQSGQRRDPLGDELRELRLGVEPGADRGAALRQRIEGLERSRHALAGVLDLRRVAGEFLAERQRRRVLRVGAADLDDVRELPGLGLQRSCAAAPAPGAAGASISSTAAMCIAVGTQSFDDWLMLT